MNVLIYVHSLFGGGAERVASIWANMLSADPRYHVLLVTNVRMDKEYPLNKEVRRLSFDDSSKPIKKYAKYKFFRRLIKSEKIDCILPFLFLPETYMSFCARGSKAAVFHNIRVNPSSGPRYERVIRDHLIKKDRLLITQNKEQLMYFAKYKKLRSYVLFNPINPLCQTVQRGHINSISKIVSVGRLCEQKNFPLLIDAVAMLRGMGHTSFTVDIYGEGEARGLLEKKIDDLKLNDVVFLKGSVKNLIELLPNYDLYIMSSNYEGFPNALLECMGVGLPCISTDCPTGPSSLIRDGENGYLIPVGDEKALVEKMLLVLRDPDAANKIASRARDDAFKMCSYASISAQLKNIIEDGCSKK